MGAAGTEQGPRRYDSVVRLRTAPAPAADPDKADIIINLATAKALPHLDNIWNKYYRIAERDGWLDEFKTVYSGRKQSLRGGA